MYDILITASYKDFNKLRFVYESIEKHLVGFKSVYVVSNEIVPSVYRISSATYLKDEEVVDFDFSKFTGRVKERTGWYRQQFIKLFQEVTSDDYLVVDSDIYINKPIEINIDKPPFLFGKDQHHLPYFRFMMDVFALNRIYPHSFINEIMFFQRWMVQYMLSTIQVDEKKFFEMCTRELNKIDDASGFSEYELYGNFVTKHWPDAYEYRYLRTRSQALRRMWTDDEIGQFINSNKNTDYDIISMHSWM